MRQCCNETENIQRRISLPLLKHSSNLLVAAQISKAYLTTYFEGIFAVCCLQGNHVYKHISLL